MVGSVCILFADDCKLYRNIESEADMMELQEDIERLCKWSRDWLSGFNIKKCKVISFGNIHFEIEYSLTDSENNFHTLSLEDSECDLGILFKKNLNFDEHIDKVVNKVNRISGLIRRKFTHIDKKTFLTLYKSLVTSTTGTGYIIQLLRSASRSWKMPKEVPKLHGMSYRERLLELNLSTLDYRRKRYDIIQMFKIIHKIDDIDMSSFLHSRTIAN